MCEVPRLVHLDSALVAPLDCLLHSPSVDLVDLVGLVLLVVVVMLLHP